MTAINDISSTNGVLEQQNSFIDQSWDNLEAKTVGQVGDVNFQEGEKKPKTSDTDNLTQSSTARETLSPVEGDSSQGKNQCFI
jgi:hypothetical protein